jgi:hypothetical protein
VPGTAGNHEHRTVRESRLLLGQRGREAKSMPRCARCTQTHSTVHTTCSRNADVGAAHAAADARARRLAELTHTLPAAMRLLTRCTRTLSQSIRSLSAATRALPKDSGGCQPAPVPWRRKHVPCRVHADPVGLHASPLGLHASPVEPHAVPGSLQQDAVSRFRPRPANMRALPENSAGCRLAPVPWRHASARWHPARVSCRAASGGCRGDSAHFWLRWVRCPQILEAVSPRACPGGPRS